MNLHNIRRGVLTANKPPSYCRLQAGARNQGKTWSELNYEQLLAQVEFLPEAFPGATAHSGFLEQLASITTDDNSTSKTLAAHIKVPAPDCTKLEACGVLQ
jgi:hypothetical protein